MGLKLVASMSVKNEVSRYLTTTLPALQAFCDEIRVQDDHSDDGTYEWLQKQEKVVVKRNEGATWRESEGKLHQQLLDFTLEGEPTHILAIDADELVLDGATIRAALETNADSLSFSLRMCEVWGTDPWRIRTDGGWRPHEVAILYRVPADPSLPEWQIWDRKLAGGRVPKAVRDDQIECRSHPLGVDILHLGWSNPDERAERYQRYVELDDGSFHDKGHLDSIMWPDSKIRMEAYGRSGLPRL